MSVLQRITLSKFLKLGQLNHLDKKEQIFRAQQNLPECRKFRRCKHHPQLPNWTQNKQQCRSQCSQALSLSAKRLTYLLKFDVFIGVLLPARLQKFGENKVLMPDACQNTTLIFKNAYICGNAAALVKNERALSAGHKVFAQLVAWKFYLFIM